MFMSYTQDINYCGEGRQEPLSQTGAASGAVMSNLFTEQLGMGRGSGGFLFL